MPIRNIILRFLAWAAVGTGLCLVPGPARAGLIADAVVCYFGGLDSDHRIAACNGLLRQPLVSGEWRADTLQMRAEILAASGRYEDALDDLDTALEIAPDDTSLLVHRGIAHYDAGYPYWAKLDLDGAIDAGTANARAFLFRGYLHFEDAEFEDALKRFEDAVEHDGKDPHVWAARGLARDHLGDFEGALSDIDRAIEIDDTVAAFFNHRGIVYSDLREYELAEKAFDRVIEMEPAYRMARISLGITLRKLGRVREAVAAFNIAIFLEPSDSDAHEEKCFTLAYALLLNEAMEACDRAIEIKPDYEELYDTRAFVLWMRGEKDRSTDDLMAAWDLNPNRPGPEYRTEQFITVAIQALLNKLGHRTDNIRGLFTAETGAAIRHYQLEQGLRVDGLPSADLLAHLERTIEG
ncbi:MAG: tetratricopeptide repeat protein [Proteobacteria bacterium]|nr:tetratricopeptide repeat protein [Pseudomonadota bacterium]